MGQWLGHGAFPAGAWVQSQVRELRSSKPHSKAKKKEKNLIQTYSANALTLKTLCVKGNKPDAKGGIMQDSTSVRDLKQLNSEAESRTVIVRARVWRRVGQYCRMGPEFQPRMLRFGGWMMTVVAQQCECT